MINKNAKGTIVNMIYDKVEFYIQTNLPKPSLDFVWSESDNEAFFNFLNENFDKKYLQQKENLLKIKQAFKNYFEGVGYIIFQLKDSKIKIRVFPYKIEPKESINLDALVAIIEANENLIDFSYNNKDDQILLKAPLVKKLLSFTSKISNEEINKKELIKYAIRVALELSESDIIINKKSEIFVKLFTYKNQVQENQKNTIAGRFNGIDESELIQFEKDYFLSGENNDFFKIVAKRFTQTYFVEQKITNNYYETKVFSLIQGIIVEQLVLQFDHNHEFFLGFAGYIFRKNFKEVFEYIAENILQEVSSVNNYMLEFLKYYSLDVIIINGKKYRIPSLTAENGQQWNSISILSVAKTYVKTKHAIVKITNEFYKKEDELAHVMVNGISPIEYNNGINKELKTLTNELASLRQKNKVSLDELYASKDAEQKSKLKLEIANVKDEIEHLNAEHKKLTAKKIDQSIIRKYVTLQKELDVLDRNYKRESLALEQNEKSYESIKEALVKALIAKKELVD